MKWFLSEVSYALWKSFDYPEHWEPYGEFRWSYKKGVICLWTSGRQHIDKPTQHYFGWIDSIFIRRKFNKMLGKRLAGVFIKALVE